MARPEGQQRGHTACRVVFFMEVIINLITIVMCWLTPRKFLQRFVRQDLLPSKTRHGVAAGAKDKGATRNDVVGACTVMNAGGEPSLFNRAESNVAVQFIRWYGVLLMVMTYASLRMLFSFERAGFVMLMEAYLLGDLLHVYAASLTAKAGGGWTAANTTGVVMAVFLAGWRVYFIMNQ